MILWISVGLLRAIVPAPPRLYDFKHPAMGTTWELLEYAPTAAKAEEDADAAFDEVDRLDELLSNYRESSELSRINRHAASQEVVTDPETFRFMQAAQHWSEVSNGAFDMSVGALMKGWGFFRRSGRVPTAKELATLRSETGWTKVKLKAETRGVRFSDVGLELDPGGIGKGFAVDAVLKTLRERDVQAAMISSGSSTIGAIGAPPGKAGWPVIVHDPFEHAKVFTTVLLRDNTLSTANCAEKNFTLSGRFYCHIMNPQTLRPVEGMVQVTILDASGTASDALSNVLFVKTPGESVGLLRTLPDDRALIVSGTEAHRQCTAIRWQAAIATDACEREKIEQ